MLIPDNLKYTADHEWLEARGAGIYRVGITDYAQDALGDVVFVEVEVVGTELQESQAFGEAESTKSVSELYAPISGTLHASNPELADKPELVNSDPYGAGWLCEILNSNGDVANNLLDAKDYAELVGEV